MLFNTATISAHQTHMLSVEFNGIIETMEQSFSIGLEPHTHCYSVWNGIGRHGIPQNLDSVYSIKVENTGARKMAFQIVARLGDIQLFIYSKTDL